MSFTSPYLERQKWGKQEKNEPLWDYYVRSIREYMYPEMAQRLDYVNNENYEVSRSMVLLACDCLVELRWDYDHRPYYNLWPAAHQLFNKLSLDKITGDSLNYIAPVICIRWHERCDVVYGDYRLQSCLYAIENRADTESPSAHHFHVIMPKLLGVQSSAKHKYEKTSNDNFVKEWLNHPDVISVGLSSNGGLVNPNTKALRVIVHLQHVKTNDKKSFSHSIILSKTPLNQIIIQHSQNASVTFSRSGSYELSVNENILAEVIKAYSLLSMLDKDSELLDRLVLSKDRLKLNNPNVDKEALIQKAIRRGVNGWDVGRHLESIPHFRRPHFGIRHMRVEGQDNLVPKLRPIKGTVVHKKKLTDVPTGYLTKEEEQNNESDQPTDTV